MYVYCIFTLSIIHALFCNHLVFKLFKKHEHGLPSWNDIKYLCKNTTDFHGILFISYIGKIGLCLLPLKYFNEFIYLKKKDILKICI